MATNFINQIIRGLVWITKFFGCKKCIKKAGNSVKNTGPWDICGL